MSRLCTVQIRSFSSSFIHWNIQPMMNLVSNFFCAITIYYIASIRIITWPVWKGLFDINRSFVIIMSLVSAFPDFNMLLTTIVCLSSNLFRCIMDCDYRPRKSDSLSSRTLVKPPLLQSYQYLRDCRWSYSKQNFKR